MNNTLPPIVPPKVGTKWFMRWDIFTELNELSGRADRLHRQIAEIAPSRPVRAGRDQKVMLLRSGLLRALGASNGQG